MPSNVEIKARVRDLPALFKAVEAIADGPPELLLQDDTFFPSPRGRLKLRLLADGTGELIAYRRPDVCGPRESRFAKAAVTDPAALAAVLDSALGSGGVVHKRRTLYRHGQTRIHLDEVEGLGTFLELEVELQGGQPPGEGERIARALMTELGIAEEELVAKAYVDLLGDRRLNSEE